MAEKGARNLGRQTQHVPAVWLQTEEDLRRGGGRGLLRAHPPLLMRPTGSTMDLPGICEGSHLLVPLGDEEWVSWSLS